MKTAGLIYDDSRHYIDHLGPFCALKNWPLIVCESAVEDLAKQYYPDLTVIAMNRWDLSFPPSIVACETKSLIEASLGVCVSSELLWLPHGHSDKGWAISFFEALKNEKTAFIYGQRMKEVLIQKNIFIPTIPIGNFRYEYWLKHQDFYRKQVRKKIHFSLKNKTYLYAPTWEDAENNCSFWKAFPLLAAYLPASYNLIVKIHPNTYLKYEIEIEKMKFRFQAKKNICFLTDFPPIYPLLDICNAYIGDMSSIGYDFLKFNRPMFFLNTKRLNTKDNPGFFLYRCGIEVLPEQIPSLFELDEGEFTKIRKEIYDYTFH